MSKRGLIEVRVLCVLSAGWILGAAHGGAGEYPSVKPFMVYCLNDFEQCSPGMVPGMRPSWLLESVSEHKSGWEDHDVHPYPSAETIGAELGELRWLYEYQDETADAPEIYPSVMSLVPKVGGGWTIAVAISRFWWNYNPFVWNFHNEVADLDESGHVLSEFIDITGPVDYERGWPHTQLVTVNSGLAEGFLRWRYAPETPLVLEHVRINNSGTINRQPIDVPDNYDGWNFYGDQIVGGYEDSVASLARYSDPATGTRSLGFRRLQGSSATPTVNLQVVSEPNALGSARLATDGIGNWLAAWINSTLLREWVESDYQYRNREFRLETAESTNGGRTWSEPVVVDEIVREYNENLPPAPAVSYAGDNRWFLTWSTGNSLIESENAYGLSVLGGDILGATKPVGRGDWGEHVILAASESGEANQRYWPKVANDHRGNLFAVWGYGPASYRYDRLGRLEAASVSNDGGRTWSAPVNAFPDVAMPPEWLHYGPYFSEGRTLSVNALGNFALATTVFAGWDAGSIFRTLSLPSTDRVSPRWQAVHGYDSEVESGSDVELTVDMTEYVKGFSAEEVVVSGLDVAYDGIEVSGGPRRYLVTLRNLRGVGPVRLENRHDGDAVDYSGNRISRYGHGADLVLIPEPVAEGEAAREGEGEAAEPLDADTVVDGFGALDTDGDGKVSGEEASGSGTPSWFGEADADGDGALSVAELLHYTDSAMLHSADANGDRGIDLSELLRVVQLYRSKGYCCAENAGKTLDGYLAEPLEGEGPDPDCRPHAADYDPVDGAISQSELLRAIQLYRYSPYAACPGESEDGFCLEG